MGGDGEGEDSDSGDSESSEGGDDSSSSSDSGDIGAAALENNTDALQARKTGKVSAMSRQLAKFGLNDDQTNRFYMLSAKAQGFILLEEKEWCKDSFPWRVSSWIRRMHSFSTPRKRGPKFSDSMIRLLSPD